MRDTLAYLGLFLTISLAPAGVAAATSLRGTMHAWRAEARTVHDMLSGRRRFDEGAMRAALQSYVTDADAIKARVNARTASGRRFKARLATFEASAQAALRDLPRRPLLAADVSHMMSGCRSCHGEFKN